MLRPDEEDAIHIEELELSVRIGVPEAERANPQRLTASLILWPKTNFRQMDNQLARTVDYAAVCREIKRLASRREDQLIETLADAIARHLLQAFPLARVRLELRKFILPDVKYVAVSLTRHAE